MSNIRILLIGSIVTLTSSCFATAKPHPGLPTRDETVVQAKAGNWYLRVSGDSQSVEGRIGLLHNDSVDVGSAKVALVDIRRIERRVPIGDTGSKAGALVGGGIGFLLSALIRPALEGLGGTHCDFQCSIGLHVLFPGGTALIGGLIGDALIANRYRWDNIWTDSH